MAGPFKAVTELGGDNFHTSIYEEGYKGLLVCRCNQNGNYPHQTAAILDGLNGKSTEHTGGWQADAHALIAELETWHGNAAGDRAIKILRCFVDAHPSPSLVQTGVAGISIEQLQAAHIERQEEWCPDQKPDLSFRGNEMAGEVGEACNVIKKLERERHGWRGSRATKEQLAEELGDVIHTAILTAISAGIDLGPAVVAKFNATSEKNGLRSRLSALSSAPAPHMLPAEIAEVLEQRKAYSDEAGVSIRMGSLRALAPALSVEGPALTHEDACRLSRLFNAEANLATAQDTRINDWLKSVIAGAKK